MVEQIDNPANKSMHYGRANVGILTPPDRLPKIVLYSSQQANKEYNQMLNDIYEKQKDAKAPNQHKIPTVLKIIGGTSAIFGILVFKKDLAKIIKGLFKKVWILILNLKFP